jgi:hypothetical protein
MEKVMGYDSCSSLRAYHYGMILISPVIIGGAIISLAIVAGIVALFTATKK